MATLFKVQATHDYSSAEADDLSFKDGEIIAVTEEIDAEWYMGFYEDEHGERRSGMFPKVFIRPYEPKAPARPIRARPPQHEPPVTKNAEDTAPPVDDVPATSPETTEDQKSETIQTMRRNVEPAPAPTSPPLPQVKQQAPSLPASSKAPPPPVAGKPGSLKDRIGMFNNPGSAPPKPIGLVPKPKPAPKPFIPPAPSSGAYVNVPKKPPVKSRPEEPIPEQTSVDRSEQAEAPQDEGPRLTLKQRKELLEKEQASHRLPNLPAEPSKTRAERGPTKELPVPPTSPPFMDNPRIPPPIPGLPKAPTELESGSGLDKDSAGDENELDTPGIDDAHEDINEDDAEGADMPGATRIGSHHTEVEVTPLHEDDNAEEPVMEEPQPSEEDAEAARKQRLRERMAKLAGQGAFSPFAPKPAPVVPRPKRPDVEAPEDETPVPISKPIPIPILPMPNPPSDPSKPIDPISDDEEEDDDGVERPSSPIERPALPNAPVSPKPLPQPPSPPARPPRRSTDNPRSSMDDSKSIRSPPPLPPTGAPSVPTSKPEGPRPLPAPEPPVTRTKPPAAPDPAAVPESADDAGEETDRSEEYDGDYDTDVHDASSVKFASKHEQPAKDLDTPSSHPTGPPPPVPIHAPPQPAPVQPQRPPSSRPQPPPVPPPRAPDDQGIRDDDSDLDADETGDSVEKPGSPAIQPSYPGFYNLEQSDKSRQRSPTGDVVQPVVPPPRVPAFAPPEPARRSLHKPSFDMSRTSIGVRPSLDQGNTARAISLDKTTPWWTYPETPPPDFQNRNDILVEVEEIIRVRHHRVERTVSVVFPDYSQTEVKAVFDDRDPDAVELTQEHFPPPPPMRQDQLENAHSRYGDSIVNAARLMQTTKMGDGSPMALIVEAFKSAPDALAPIGSRSFGALVYENMSNASVKSHDEIRPGDIVSMRNAKFQGKHGIKSYSKELREHVGIVDEWDGAKKKIYALEQGRDGKNDKKGVDRESYKVSDLKSGEIKIWRVVGRAYGGLPSR